MVSSSQPFLFGYNWNFKICFLSKECQFVNNKNKALQSIYEQIVYISWFNNLQFAYKIISECLLSLKYCKFKLKKHYCLMKAILFLSTSLSHTYTIYIIFLLYSSYLIISKTKNMFYFLLTLSTLSEFGSYQDELH